MKIKIGSNINEPVFYEHLSAVGNLEIHCDYIGSSKKRYQKNMSYSSFFDTFFGGILVSVA